jgi:hypothetical protein
MGLLQQPHDRLDMWGGRQGRGQLLGLCDRVACQHRLGECEALVLHRHVWLDDDGRHAQVLSADGQTWYLVNGNCTCLEAPQAPEGLCAHRLAVGLYRRASELLHSQGQPEASAPAPALPEAPASVNVRLAIGGTDVQWTLRDQCEERLAERLERLLQRFPQVAKVTAIVAPDGGTPTATPTCPYHGAMRESTKAKGTFYCPSRMGDGTYCKERFPAK